MKSLPLLLALLVMTGCTKDREQAGLDKRKPKKNCDTCIEWREQEFAEGEQPKGAEITATGGRSNGTSYFQDGKNWLGMDNYVTVRYLYIGKSVRNPDSVYQYRIWLRDSSERAELRAWEVADSLAKVRHNDSIATRDRLGQSAEDAAHAYDVRAKELHGEFAYLNFPEKGR